MGAASTGLRRRRSCAERSAPRPLHRKGWIFFFLAASFAGAPQAQVLDVSPDGAAVWRNGPAVYTLDGVVPIPPPVLITPARKSPPPASSAGVGAALMRAAARHGVDQRLVWFLAARESALRPQAVSRRDAVGVMQLTATTATDLGVDRFDTAQNIEGGVAYLRRMLDTFGGDRALALAAYNAGPQAVRRYGAVPPFPETRAYVAAILTAYNTSDDSRGPRDARRR